MLTIWGIVLVAAGILLGLLAPRVLPRMLSGPVPAALAAMLVVSGAGLQVYEAWWKLPAHCRSALLLTCPAPSPPPSRRR